MPKLKHYFFIFSFLAVTFCFLAPSAHAAPLNFTSATPVVLTSPSTTLIIATGSVAESLTVNATSVVVGMSNTTGGSFTLLSPSYDLMVATSRAGGTVTKTCPGGQASLVLSQTTGSTTYTITPGALGCTLPTTSPSPVVTTGGGYVASSFLIDGGAGSTASSSVTLSFAAPPDVASFAMTTSYDNLSSTATSSYASTQFLNLCAGFSSCPAGTYFVSVNFLDAKGNSLGIASQSISYTGSTGASTVGAVSPVSPATSSFTLSIPSGSSTIAQLEAFLAELETELQTLLKEAAARDIVVQGAPASATSSSTYAFIRNLQLWDEGIDVNELQRYLVAQDSGPAAQALARHGTTYTFGPLTYAALKEFQKAVGIVPDSGYFGPITRGYTEAHGD